MNLKAEKVLLVNPVYAHLTTKVMPMGLSYIAAVLKQNNIHVNVLDANALNMSDDEILRNIQKAKPDVLGITITTPQVNNVRPLIKKIKEQGLKLMVGGPHPTVRPDDCLNSLEADVAIRGEGEHTVLELCQGKPMEEIHGISFGKNGKVVHNPERKLIESLDTLPEPARELFPNNLYKTPATGARFATVLTSRGCPFFCIYCNKSNFGRKFRYRSAENVVKEIMGLINNYSVEDIYFIDDVFTYDKERVILLCDLMRKEGIHVKWRCSGGTRIDCINEELLKHMKDAGCYQISFGVESGNETVLKRIGRNVTKSQIRHAFKLSKESGMETIAFFMLGLPYDTKETMQETIDFSIELDPDYAQFTITTPLPETPLWNFVKKRGTFLFDTNLSDFNFFEKKAKFITEGLTAEDVVHYYEKAYRSFYFRPKYLLKALMRIRSLRDVKGLFASAFTVFNMLK